jgi:hypothetical protein
MSEQIARFRPGLIVRGRIRSRGSVVVDRVIEMARSHCIWATDESRAITTMPDESHAIGREAPDAFRRLKLGSARRVKECNGCLTLMEPRHQSGLTTINAFISTIFRSVFTDSGGSIESC